MQRSAQQLQRPLLSLLLVGALLVSGGCSAGERATQCNLLAKQVNQGLAPLKQHIDAHPELARGSAAPEDYADLAARYSSLSESTKVTPLADPRIVELRDDYAKLFEETSDACTNLKDARANDNASAQSRAELELKRLARRQDSLLKQTKALCEPR